ncbi:flagellar basal-body MS-ring/collar protein FliF [methanotrophic endosymbiont of Bathymodiolus puteoserpentis (Logatchev)]|jgi:flagellar M-ring protein FliF|uniref:flagellar basal-body MS-ring/collar protein FliF n=1 Tax=methanotrophic endosymbiont of Bathymodiolus puteoserpentis (Logatchev) TaxID=343235 RepID=UPI0013C79D7B|nr:flagellar basal-body MS-ring/collar protein FliF [methanotrophic endosymbiont of Bathymodiolus puteoserpentis (Logatchev)]SHE21931.1 Flagellar M-ring protein FliF [methanotrophic endosymbiont of Bathymodiolus puteoserpentis (Logatchev)]
MSEQESSNSLASTASNTGNQMVAEESETKAIHPAMEGLVQMTVIKQVGLMLGLAFSVAIGVAVVLWSQAPTYDLLFSSLGEQDAAEILETLDKLDVPYKVDERSGAVMVAAGKVRDIKLKLAAEGLPRSDSLGYELLDKEASFTTSKSVETMRFQRALEGEIARTVMTIQNVKSARVLLALPKQSVFVRKQKKPSASVILNLYRGRALEKGQINAIVHLVASSVPLMEAAQVTVVDQKGRLLSSKDTGSNLALTNKQFEYKKAVEDHLMTRIENILMPIVGPEGMRVQISAEVDFTVTEQTQEMFNPDLPALRSEQTTEDISTLSAIQGVPGALSNQPPPAGVAPEIAVGEGSGSTQTPTSSSKAATRNFELDKTITHSRLASGIVRRLSVAVVVDDKRVLTADGSVSTLPFAPEDLNRLTELVKRAIGYDMRRGDEVMLTNAAFRIPDELEALPAEPLWEQAWFIDLMKQLAAALVVLFIVFGVLRPTMRGLVAKEEEPEEEKDIVLDENGIPVAVPMRYDEDGNPIPVSADDEGQMLSSETEDLLLLEAPQSYEKRLEYVKKLVDEDPKLVAQVLKGWIDQDV